MPFFARPDLSDEQFKQLAGSQLTLSGQTRIATTSGLTLTDGLGGYIPIIATGATNLDVLTYNSATNQITLQPSTGGGSGVYSGASPTTCTVGGLVAGSPIFNCSISTILEEILVPTLAPTYILPASSSFDFAPPSISTCYAEINSSVTISGCTIFSRGCVSPQYCGTSEYRSGLPTCYQYCKSGLDIPPAVVSSSLSNKYSFGSVAIACGSNQFGSMVFYAAGTTPIYNSSGTDLNMTQQASGTSYSNQIICGIYPFYYGKVSSGGVAAGANRPLPSPLLITSGNKVVGYSMNTIPITFCSTSDDYIWFAIPNVSTSKTKWCIDALNNGNIGGAVSVGGNLFPAENIITNVSNECWSNQTYKLYISNYQSASSTIMYLKNS